MTVAFAVCALAACGGSSIVPLDIKPSDGTQAEDLGYSVANEAGCGNFEALDPQGTQGTWHFTCQIGSISYDIVIFGNDEARQTGVRAIGSLGQPFAAKNYYAVTVAPSGPSKSAASGASISPSLLAPFK